MEVLLWRNFARKGIGIESHRFKQDSAFSSSKRLYDGSFSSHADAGRRLSLLAWIHHLHFHSVKDSNYRFSDAPPISEVHNPPVIRSTSPGDVARIDVRMPQNENKESNDWGSHPDWSDFRQRETFSLWCCYRFFGNGWMNPLWVVDPWSSKSDCSLRENMAVNIYGKLIQRRFESCMLRP